MMGVGWGQMEGYYLVVQVVQEGLTDERRDITKGLW